MSSHTASSGDDGAMQVIIRSPKSFVKHYTNLLNCHKRMTWAESQNQNQPGVKQQKTEANVNKKDRELMLSMLAMLYAHEHDALEKERESRKLEAKKRAALSQMSLAAAAAAMAASRAAKSNTPSAVVVPASRSEATAAATASRNPSPLPTECNVCYRSFTSSTQSASDADMSNDTDGDSDNDDPCIRLHFRLCGHASICSDCMRSYLVSRISSGDVLPYINCPHPDCKTILHHTDIAMRVPTEKEAREWEEEYERNRQVIIRRNEMALQKATQKKGSHNKGSNLASASSTSSASSSRTPSPSSTLRGIMTRSQTKKAATQTSASSVHSSSTHKDEDSEMSTEYDDGLVALFETQAPSASSSSHDSAKSHATDPSPPPFLIPSQMLLKLVTHHSNKLLLRYHQWLPCGTHQHKPQDDDEKMDVDHGQTASSPTATPSSTSTNSNAPPSTSCLGGFLLVPPLYTPGSSKTKLKKCEHCGLLQEVKPAHDPAAAAAADSTVDEMIKAGTLRPCPSCQAFQMKDKGMCNVMQCHNCQIWWNWRDRTTGKNPQALKDKARREGTMWEAGELQYQLRLQQENPEAFKELLRRNGIEYNPNYVRGYTR